MLASKLTPACYRFARCPCSIKAATCKYENIAPMGLTFEFDWTRFLEAATGPEQAVFPSETITIHDFLLCSPNTKLKQKRLRSNNRTDCTNEQSSNFRWEKPYPLSNKLEGRFRTPAELNHGAYLAPGSQLLRSRVQRSNAAAYPQTSHLASLATS